MNWRWLVFDYVDPRLKLGRAERRAVRRRSDKLFNPSDRYYWSSLLATGTIFGIGAVATMLMLQSDNGVLMSGAIVAMPVTAWVAIAFGCRRAYAQAVSRALREIGHDVCPHCGYWLRGLGKDVKQCPECGAAREAIPTAPIEKQ